MRVDRIQLRDVGPFDDVTLDFPPGSDPNLADVYLLTGPNGSGKSTVLYAIAAAISGGRDLGRDLAAGRLRQVGASASVTIGGASVVILRGSSADAPKDEAGETMGHTASRGDGVRYFASMNGAIRHYADAATAFRVSQAREPTARFEWAAFAYAGKRSLEDVHIRVVRDPEDSPFQNSLSFTETANAHRLAEWVVNQQFLRLKALDAGRDERAARLERSIRDIEHVVASIVEDPSFRFVSNDEDNDIRVRWQGTDINFGQLPDGLKSIVSWTADLLMRLDRIPWVDDIPTTQRSFLLLLDEIDIHLHPAWQRKVLPFVQRAFPNAQIIASTHSPFVVASASDAHIITLGLRQGKAVLEHTAPSQLGTSYSAVLRSIFGIDSEFDIETERDFERFHQAKARLLGGDSSARVELDAIAAELAARSEELRELVALELVQLRRQVAQRPAS